MAPPQASRRTANGAPPGLLGIFFMLLLIVMRPDKRKEES
jgi:hypothetical protein